MALIHTDADLNPGKLELLAAWVPLQPWGSPDPLERVASYRFDDPDGEVGIETFLLRAGGLVLHVPLTYRGGPLHDGALVGEMEHSALGHRWVYDGPTDPVYLDVVSSVIAEQGQEAALVGADGEPLGRPATGAAVRGSGLPAGSEQGGEVQVVRRVGVAAGAADGVLTGTWVGQSEPVVLVRMKVS